MSRIGRVVLAVTSLSLFLVADLTVAQTWQQSASTEVNLSVRDKYGQLGVYSVVFSVKDPSGTVISRTIRAKGDEWALARFPTDFDTYLKSGRYTWKATITGRNVANGDFIYEVLSGVGKVSVTQ